MGGGQQEGFFSSLLNDEELQMMDVGMPEGNLYCFNCLKKASSSSGL